MKNINPTFATLPKDSIPESTDKPLFASVGIFMNEIWKDIEGYEGLYQVSNTGKVKSISRYVHHKNGLRLMKEIILKAGVGTTGYYLVSLSKELKQHTIKLHRLVAIAFIPNPENKREVNHLDGNKLNNNDWNLEWSTAKENVKHAWLSGFCKPTWTGIKGKDNPSSKKVIQTDKTGITIKIFDSVSEANINTGFKHISCCALGNRKSAGGYIWKYL